MSERHLVAAVLDRVCVQRTTAQFGAQGAGASLVSILEHDLADVGIHDLKVNADALRKRLNL